MKKVNLPIRYGGSSCDQQEYKAVMKSVKESIKTGGWQQGEQGALFEKELSRSLKTKHAILTSSGSCAGLLALASLELPKGSEVIISAVTFPTIFNIILQCGLIPVIVDAKVGTYNLEVEDVERAITNKTRAIIAIHALGNPVDMPKLMSMVKKVNSRIKQGFAKYEKDYSNHKIYVIEDNCDGWGSTIKGKMIGSFGDLSITSFHAAHIISMGVGGGVFTNDKKLAQKVRQYRDWGRIADTNKPHTCPTLPKDYNPRFVYDKIGYNFQILDLQAAMGRIQLRKAKRIKKLRKQHFDYLVKRLRKYDELIMPQSIKGADVCWFSLPLTYIGDRGALVRHLEKKGIETRSMFAGQIHKHPAYRSSTYVLSGNLDESEYILEHSFWISVHPRLTKVDMDYIVKTIDDFLNGKSN